MHQNLSFWQMDGDMWSDLKAKKCSKKMRVNQEEYFQPSIPKPLFVIFLQTNETWNTLLS